MLPPYITFYSRSRPPWNIFSNFFLCDIRAFVPYTFKDRKTYPERMSQTMPGGYKQFKSTEHFYVYVKIRHFYSQRQVPDSLLRKFEAAQTGSDVKSVGKLIDMSDPQLCLLWEEVKADVMTLGLYAKAISFDSFRTLLILTRSRELHEHIPYLRGKIIK